MARSGPRVFLLIALCCIGGSRSAPYVGKLIGKLSELHHGVSGEVYAVDGRTLYIKDFTYDGQGPGAYFYASTKAADKSGFRLRDETGSGDVIRRYRKEGVTLTLPEGKTLNNIKIFYVWCEDFDVNFGDVKIPRNFDYPRPQKIAALKGVHSISSDNIVIVDAQTLLIPNLSYDGEAPDAKFWVGRGPKPSPQGIRVPDENGKEAPLRRYESKTVVLTLPGDLTVFDVGHFGIWCEQFTVDFGHVVIPEGLDVPPSLKMLGVSPQKIHQHQPQATTTTNKVSRPLVGGHLQPTTFRPPSVFGRRNDVQPPQFITQQGLVLAQNQVGQQYHRARGFAFENIPAPAQNHQGYNHIRPYVQQYQPQGQVQQLVQSQLSHQQLQYQNQVPQIQVPYIHQSNQILSQPQHNQILNQNHVPTVQSSVYQPVHQQIVNYSQLQQQQQQQHQHQQQQRQQNQQNNVANINRRQYQEQLAYDQYLQSRRLQEEEYLRNQLSRQHIRFLLPNNQNFHAYG